MEKLEARLSALDALLTELNTAIKSIEATQQVLADALREFSLTLNTAEDTNQRIRSIEMTTSVIEDRIIAVPATSVDAADLCD